MGSQNPKAWRKLPHLLALILALGAGFAWAMKNPSEPPRDAASSVPAPEPASAERAPARVQAVRVQRIDLSLRSEATGYLEPWRKVEIRTEVPGRVVGRMIEEGRHVVAGQLLVRLDDRDRRIEMEEGQAEWLKTQAEYAVNYSSAWETSARVQVPSSQETSEVEVRRSEKLLREGLLSKRQVDEVRRRYETSRMLSGSRQSEVRAATSGLAQAEQRVERGRLGLERTRILAPFSGRVADLAVEVGQQVSPGENLFTLLQDDRLKVDVDVLEADMALMRVGAPARVRIPSLDNLNLEGSVHTINPRIDSETGTGRVTVATANPRQLLISGLFAFVDLETKRLPGRLVVPSNAVLLRQGRELVFRIENGRALWTYVTTGAKSGDQVEIVEGLSEGDWVASSDHFALAHEAPVEVLLTAPPGSSRRSEF